VTAVGVDDRVPEREKVEGGMAPEVVCFREDGGLTESVAPLGVALGCLEAWVGQAEGRR